MAYITILFNLSNSSGKIVKGQTIIRDEMILSKFSDPNLARQIYEYDIKDGQEVAFNEKNNAYIKKYKGMKKREIARLFKKELEKAGGKQIKLK